MFTLASVAAGVVMNHSDAIAQGVPLPPLDTLETAVAEQLQAAAREVEQATSKRLGDKRLAEAYGFLGQVFHAYEFFEPAEAAYTQATHLASGDVRWHHLLGHLYEQTGRLDDAAERFTTVGRMQPGHREAAVHLGGVYLRLNRLRDARERFQDLVETFPAVARNGLGEVALREGRFQEAVGHFRAVLERVPQAGAVHYSLAMAYRGLGRLDEARAHLQRQGPGGVRAVDPIVDSLQALVRGERALVMQGRRAYEAGQFQDAAESFAKALSAAPESATARANLGLALLAQQGRASEAVDHLRIAFQQAPDDASVRSGLLRGLLRLGQDDDAIDVLTRARTLDPDDEEMLVTLSILLAHRQRYVEAAAVLEEGNRRFPDRTTTATTLARLLASSPDRSIRDGRRALDLANAVYASSPAPVHGETVALALTELGRCAEASEWMRRAVVEAEHAQDAAEVVRLKGELSKYGTDCRR